MRFGTGGSKLFFEIFEMKNLSDRVNRKRKRRVTFRKKEGMAGKI